MADLISTRMPFHISQSWVVYISILVGLPVESRGGDWVLCRLNVASLGSELLGILYAAVKVGVPSPARMLLGVWRLENTYSRLQILKRGEGRF